MITTRNLPQDERTTLSACGTGAAPTGLNNTFSLHTAPPTASTNVAANPWDLRVFRGLEASGESLGAGNCMRVRHRCCMGHFAQARVGVAFYITYERGPGPRPGYVERELPCGHWLEWSDTQPPPFVADAQCHLCGNQLKEDE